jgi:cobalt-zinc-cadmium efflux system outer membrane protein
VKRSLVAVLLAACVPSASELRAPVDRAVAARLGDTAGSVDALLAKPLTADSAVRIAIANSPRLRADYAELGIAGGELAAALSVGPFSIDAMYRRGGDAYELEIDSIQSVLGLVTAPRRRAAANADLEAARAHATASTLRLASRVVIAFSDLVAAQQELELRRTAFDAADVAATLRERMHAAGNTSDLAQARDRAAREQARVDVGRAEAEVAIRREAVNALLGLSGDQTKWTATGALPDLPATAPSLDELEAHAVAASLELVESNARVTGAANRAGDTRVRAWLPELGVGVSVIDRDGKFEVGPAVRLGIPLLDQSRGQRARAEAELERDERVRDAVAVELRARARAARVAALAAHAEARHVREIVLPLRQQIVDETLKHYNAMDADPFQLIVARRDLVEAGHEYLEALRRYWRAMTEVTALERGVSLGD